MIWPGSGWPNATSAASRFGSGGLPARLLAVVADADTMRWPDRVERSRSISGAGRSTLLQIVSGGVVGIAAGILVLPPRGKYAFVARAAGPCLRQFGSGTTRASGPCHGEID